MSDQHRTGISVTDVAGLGICEQQVVLDKQFGKARSNALQKKAKDGIKAHEAFDRQIRGATDPRCFIATAVFGELAAETNMLRRFRDEQLMPRKFGPKAIKLYYRISPVVASLIKRFPFLGQAFRAGLTTFLAYVRHQQTVVKDD